uniref:DNA-directed RNA polymerase subunit G n=1 Tax=Ignisphaera aggregans TaxID=334771 RepID=A0A7J3MYI5_9CREN
MSMELSCKVVDVVDSYLPNVNILNIDCGIAIIKMDIHKELTLAKKGDLINIGIYKSLPSYAAGKDFLAHGYVITKKKDENHINIYISLWGYLIVIKTNENRLNEYLNTMDKVYIKLWK